MRAPEVAPEPQRFQRARKPRPSRVGRGRRGAGAPRRPASGRPGQPRGRLDDQNVAGDRSDGVLHVAVAIATLGGAPLRKRIACHEMVAGTPASAALLAPQRARREQVLAHRGEPAEVVHVAGQLRHDDQSACGPALAQHARGCARRARPGRAAPRGCAPPSRRASRRAPAPARSSRARPAAHGLAHAVDDHAAEGQALGRELAVEAARPPRSRPPAGRSRAGTWCGCRRSAPPRARRARGSRRSCRRRS